MEGFATVTLCLKQAINCTPFYVTENDLLFKFKYTEFTTQINVYFHRKYLSEHLIVKKK